MMAVTRALCLATGGPQPSVQSASYNLKHNNYRAVAPAYLIIKASGNVPWACSLQKKIPKPCLRGTELYNWFSHGLLRAAKSQFQTKDPIWEDLNKPDLILPQHCVSVSDLKISAPYHFDHSKFPSWEKQPGNTTLRISNAGIRDNNAIIYLAFNNWKYDQFTNKKRETSNKKRKLESEIVPETISNEIVCEECQPMEIKTEA